jgi:hypothetical protein
MIGNVFDEGSFDRLEGEFLPIPCDFLRFIILKVGERVGLVKVDHSELLAHFSFSTLCKI